MGCRFPSLGDLPNPGIEHTSPALQVDSLPLSHVGSPPFVGDWEVNYDASSQCNEAQPVRDLGSPRGSFQGVSQTKAGAYPVSLWRLSEVFLEGCEKSAVLVLEVSLLGGRGGAPGMPQTSCSVFCFAPARLLQAFLVTEPHTELAAPGAQAHGFTILFLHMGGGPVSPDTEGLSLPTPLHEGGSRLPQGALGVPAGLAGSSDGMPCTPAWSAS